MRTFAFSRNRLTSANVTIASPGTWIADYGNAKIEFQLRRRPRFHSLAGLNRVIPGTRHRDFSGKVLVSHLCKTYSGQGDDTMSLPSCLNNSAYFGIGCRLAQAPRRSALRKWLSSELGRSL